MVTERDEYTWELATKDLALSTHLTVQQAGRITWALQEKTTLHPFDAIAIMVRLVKYLSPAMTLDNLTWWTLELVAFNSVMELQKE